MQNKVSLWQVVREGSFLFQTHSGLFYVLIFCLHGPINLLRTVVSFEILAIQYGKQNISLLLSGIKLLDDLIGLCLFIGVAYIVENSRKGDFPTLASALRFAFPRIVDVLWVGILFYIICLGLSLLLIIPGIIWWNYYSFALYIVTLRGIKGKAALDSSKKLVKGQAWKIFGIQFAITAALICINLPVFLLARKVPEIPYLSIFLRLTIQDITSVIATVMGVVLFLNVEYIYKHQNEIAIEGQG